MTRGSTYVPNEYVTMHVADLHYERKLNKSPK